MFLKRARARLNLAVSFLISTFAADGGIGHVSGIDLLLAVPIFRSCCLTSAGWLRCFGGGSLLAVIPHR